MPTPKKKPTKKKPKKPLEKFIDIKYKERRFHVLLDKVLLFRVMRRLHGRFWGVAGLTILAVMLIVASFIRPDIIANPSGALSEFGTDTRTAPWFAFGMFFAAYGLWRWRSYLERTLKRKRPMSWLIMLTIIGLLLVAFMPMDWKPYASRVHLFGFFLVGVSMVGTVVADWLLTKVRPRKHLGRWRFLRFISLIMIIVGGVLSLGSNSIFAWFDLLLIGEVLMLGGYAIWVGIKTHLGEGSRSRLSRLLNKIVLVD